LFAVTSRFNVAVPGIERDGVADFVFFGKFRVVVSAIVPRREGGLLGTGLLKRRAGIDG
jgi:hypothetical protein